MPPTKQTAMLPGLGGGTGGAQLTPGQLPTPQMSPVVTTQPKPTSPQVQSTGLPQGGTQPGQTLPQPQQVPMVGGTPLPPMTIPQMMEQPKIVDDLSALYGSAAVPSPMATNETADKYNTFFDSKKGTEAPPTNPMRDTAMQETLQEGIQVAPEDPTKSFADALSGMNPVERNLYDQIQMALSSTATKTSLAEELNKAFTDVNLAAGIPGESLSQEQVQYMNLKNVMEGTEDDLRTEITKAGGFATESQVLALTGARNKVLMKQANLLLQSMELKQDYIDNLMKYTQLDREEVEKQVDRKIGFSKDLVDLQDKIDKAAQSNLDQIIKTSGYVGLGKALEGSKQAMANAEKLLGLPPGTLAKKDVLEALDGGAEDEGFTLSEGQTRYDSKGNPIASKAKSAPSSSDSGDLLSVEDTIKLGVPYGTTKGQAAGITPKKPLSSIQTTDLIQAQLSLSNVKRIDELINNLGSQGPAIGRFRSANPYDTKVVELQNLITQTVPSLARGIFKEVGVLTDTDIERYQATLANPKLTKEQAANATKQLLKTINRSINIQLDTYDAAGKDIREFDSVRESVAEKRVTVSKGGQKFTIPESQLEEAEAEGYILY